MPKLRDNRAGRIVGRPTIREISRSNNEGMEVNRSNNAGIRDAKQRADLLRKSRISAILRENAAIKLAEDIAAKVQKANRGNIENVPTRWQKAR